MYMKPYLQYLFYPKTVLVPSFFWTSRIDKSHFGADIAIQWYGAASSCHPVFYDLCKHLIYFLRCKVKRHVFLSCREAFASDMHSHMPNQTASCFG